MPFNFNTNYFLFMNLYHIKRILNNLAPCVTPRVINKIQEENSNKCSYKSINCNLTLL